MEMREYLEDVKDEAAFTMPLIIVDKTPTEKTKGEQKMIVLEVADKTKMIKARFFGSELECNDFYNSIQLSQVYEFSGVFSSQYNSFIIDKGKMTLVTKPNWDDFNLNVEISKDQSDKLFEYINQIQNKHVKLLLESIFGNKKLLEKFLTFPAAVMRHHAVPNGLITHILEMLKIAEVISTVYPKINKDVLFCGCILHDIGKIDELKTEYGVKYTDEGELLSHIPIAFSLISDKISQIEDFPIELSNQIQHMILSHHGKPSWDKPSFMEPKTLEALALHYIDMLSAKLSPIHDIVGETQGWQKIVNQKYFVGKL